MITFMAPDLATFSGGLKVIDAYVRALNENGLPARVWHGTTRAAYPDATAPTVYGRRLSLDAGDVLVMPETGGQKWQFLTRGAPTVMLCQGTDFVFANTDFTTALPGPYPGWPNATAVVGVSDSIVAFLRAACDPGFEIHHVPVEIDTHLFRPLAKEKRIALMPRRRREDLLAAVQLIRASGLLDEWELEIIDGMTAPQVAAALGRSAIFLFGAEREGVGLPGAEAMAAGAYVVGFTGHGAKEYLLPAVSTVIPESDVVRMRDETIRVAGLFTDDRASYDRATAAGRDLIVARYGHDVMAAALVTAFRAITAPGSPSVLTAPVTVDHFEQYGPRPGRGWEAYVAARTVAGRLKRRVRGAVDARG